MAERGNAKRPRDSGLRMDRVSEACAVHGHGLYINPLRFGSVKDSLRKIVQSSLGVDIWPLVDFVIIASAQTDQHRTNTRSMAFQYLYPLFLFLLPRSREYQIIIFPPGLFSISLLWRSIAMYFRLAYGLWDILLSTNLESSNR